jgi:hypothetical protein
MNFIHLYEKIDQLKKEEAFYSWSKTIHDLDYQTIAEITNVSIGTVKSRLHHGLQILKDYYRGDVNE